MITSSYEKHKLSYLFTIAVFFIIVALSFGTFTGFVVDLYFDEFKFKDNKPLGTYLLILAGCLFILLNFLSVRLKFSFRGSFFFYLILIWLGVIQFFREDLDSSVKNFFNIFLMQVALLLAINLFWRIPFNTLMKFILVYIHILMAISLVLHLVKIGPLDFGNHEPVARLSGLFYYAYTGFIAGLGIVLSSFLLFSSPTTTGKAVYAVSILVLFVYVLGTDMRTVMTASGAAIFIQYLFKRISEKKQIWPVIALAILFFAGFQYYKENIGNSDIDDDLETRELIWRVSNKAIDMAPWVGYGNYNKVLNKVAHNDADYFSKLGFQPLDHPHSSFLNLILQSGKITLVLFILFMLSILFHIKSLKGANKGILSIVVFWIICGISWGGLYNMDYSIDSLFFELSVLGLILHPDLMKTDDRQAITNAV